MKRQWSFELGRTGAKSAAPIASTVQRAEVWESKESWESSRDERVHPAVASVLAKVGISEPPAPPAERSLDVIDVWMGKS